MASANFLPPGSDARFLGPKVTPRELGRMQATTGAGPYRDVIYTVPTLTVAQIHSIIALENAGGTPLIKIYHTLSGASLVVATDLIYVHALIANIPLNLSILINADAGDVFNVESSTDADTNFFFYGVEITSP